MKKVTSILTVSLLSLAAGAQSSSTTIPAASDQSTSTATLEAQKPESEKKSKWSASFVNEVDLVLKDINEKGSKAKMTSPNIVSVGYKVTDSDKISLADQFQYNIVPDVADRGETPNGYGQLDPYIAHTHSFSNPLLGSDPISLTSRYYMPVSELGVKSAGFDNGVVRFDSEIQWTLNKLWAVSLYLNPRLYFSSSAETTLSAREYGIVYLNPTTSLQFYQMAGIKTGVGSLIQGRKTKESIYAETGVNYTVNTHLSFNFYLGSEANTETGNVATLYRDDNDTTNYGLITQVTF